MERPRERKHRLPEAAYVGRKSVSFTACVRERRPLLADKVVVDPLVELLAEVSRMHGAVIPIYCFMPDHLHVVITGATEHCRVKGVMETFKHRSGLWLEKHHPDIKWQSNFYDRIVRKSEDYAAHIRYIACNPIRAGLAEDIHQWPFTGSIRCDLREVLGDAFW